MKNHIRDYATEAFRFYARIGMTADKYKQKIYDEALEDYKQRQKSAGISYPTEAAIIRAEKAVDEKLAEIKDIEAVEMTMAELQASLCNHGVIEAIDIVYFKDADKKLRKGDIHDRVHIAEINIPASERTIYYWLGQARQIFAENRGLRI